MARAELHDEDVTRELSRRAAGEWQPERVLPAVRRGMEVRPERVHAPRWGVVAGFAALAAVLIVLAVALPRLDLGPSAWPTPEGGLVVLSAEDFAARLLAGELDGMTVLVEGRIEPSPAATDQFCTPPDVCRMGRLAGTTAQVELSAPWIAVPEDEVNAASVDSAGWNWWSRAQAPVEGLLALSVDRFGSVEFLGTARPVAEGKIGWAPAAVSSLDVGTLSLDETLIVEGWLTQVSGIISGQPPAPGTFLEGLPTNWSGNDAWIGPEPVILDPEGYVDPQGAVRVQNGAMYLVRGEREAEEPVQGRFVVSRRLFGGGCPDNVPPCWGWQVIGVLSHTDSTVPPDDVPTPALPTATEAPQSPPAPDATNAPPSLAPSPSQVPAATASTVECTGAPMPPGQGAVWVEDNTGFVIACEVAAGVARVGDISSSPDPPSITVSWSSPCVADPHLTRLELWHRSALNDDRYARRGEPPFLLVLDRIDTTDSYGCFTAVTGRQVTLLLHETIDEADVELMLTDNGRGIDSSEHDAQTFELVLEAGKHEYAASEAIDLTVTLTYTGADSEVQFADHMAPILGFEQLDGDLVQFADVREADCRDDGPITLRSDERVVLPYRKVAGWSSDDPNSAFYSSYVSDPELRLLPGTYRLFVRLAAWTNGVCGASTSRDFTLEPSIIVRVR